MGEFGIINNADVMRGAREFTAASEDRKKRKISRSQEDDNTPSTRAFFFFGSILGSK
jgi:hypothetical protein